MANKPSNIINEGILHVLPTMNVTSSPIFYDPMTDYKIFQVIVRSFIEDWTLDKFNGCV